MRPRTLLAISLGILAVALTVMGWRFVSAPTVLQVAVGPSGSEDARLLAAASQYLSRHRSSLRLKILQTAGEAESAGALDEGRADLAVVRTDVALPETGQAVAVMHRDAAVLVAPASRGIAVLSDLRGRTVAVVRDLAANSRLLDAILAQDEMGRDDVRIVALPSAGEAEAVLRSGRADALLAVGSMGGHVLSQTVAAATAASDGAPPVFLSVPESEAIVLRHPAYEALDLVRGVFGGRPPRPALNVRTLAVSHRLLASTALDESVVSELTKQLFEIRPSLAKDNPLANRIEAADTSKDSTVPVHPGALAYYDDEVQTFFDRYDDFIYIGAMLLSVVGSGVVGLMSTAAAKRRSRALGLLDRLLAIVHLARAAATAAELDALQAEVDGILGVALDKAGSGGLDHAAVSAFTLGLEQARHAIDERRRTLARPASDYVNAPAE
jgi:TRAP transporter TAXI family solute receptor